MMQQTRGLSELESPTWLALWWRVAKKTLKVTVGIARFNDDELQTAIREVEALMNSRPLSYGGTDPSNEPVLTPSHFLIGQLGGQLAPQVTDELAVNPRNRWRLIQNLVKIFWKRWRDEFLATLNTRKKWRDKKDNLKIGDEVLVVDQNARGQWPRARWEGARCPSDQKRPQVYRPNFSTVSIERLRLSRRVM